MRPRHYWLCAIPEAINLGVKEIFLCAANMFCSVPQKLAGLETAKSNTEEKIMYFVDHGSGLLSLKADLNGG